MFFDLDTLTGLLADYSSSHSNVQIDKLIIARAGWTPYGMYKQALMEMETRYKGLKSLYIEIARNEIDYDELTQKVEGVQTDIDRRRTDLDLKEKAMRLDDLQRQSKDVSKEFMRFYGQAAMLKDQLGVLTPDRVDHLEDELRRELLKKHAAVEVITTGSVSGRTVEAIVALGNQRGDLLEWVGDHGALVGYLENYDIPIVDCEPQKLEAAELKRLLKKCHL